MRAKVSSIELGGIANLAVLAPIKAGFVDGFETITYLDRLRRLLKAMHSSRQNVRESELRKPVFADAIGRFGIIHSFRYAIVPPFPETVTAADPGISRLSLNVSFDGAWEPYMRVIYRDIGTLLDALFCHCVGYPGATRATFDDYCRWVRSYEIDGGIFYTDSSLSMGDGRYLSEVERLRREMPDPATAVSAPAASAPPDSADAAIAQLALAPARVQAARSMQNVAADPKAALALSLRTLKGLYRLSTYFPDSTADGAVLIRFAQSVLKEFRQAISHLDPASELAQLAARLLADELAWLALDRRPKVADPRPLVFAESGLQSAMLGQDGPITHGCVVMLAVRHAKAAAAHFATLAAACAAPADPADPAAVRYHVAFSHAGLAALKLDPERLDALPQEFVEGMEARCGLLGDVRGNHPDRWTRPLRYRADPQPGDRVERIDLTAVHAVVVLRLIDPANLSPEVHPTLAAAVAALAGPRTGLRVLAVQPTKRHRDDRGNATEPFGFADGLSQPTMVEGDPAPRSDEVRRGELLLGHRNDRGDGPFPKQADDLLDNASFLVMRKLRQHTDTLDAVLAGQPDRADVLARMMGRRPDGTPLVAAPAGAAPNGFTFDGDPHGIACPFDAHIRRANPRDGRDYLPRILRRGMAYGPPATASPTADPAAERGIVFMAYCASIAEQFETLQRWIAGGNSSGVSSAQADPFLGVPQFGERRVFRYIDAAGKVARVDLGAKPLVQLEWGLYLFVPSLKALRMLADFRRPPAEPSADPEEPMPIEPLEVWRRRLEDPDRSKAEWQRVREQGHGGLKAPPYGTLLGTAERVLEVLKDDASRYSVQGYGERMAASIGLNHLGMDPAGGHAQLGPIVNAAIEAIGMAEAFKETQEQVGRALEVFTKLKQPDPSGPARVPIDLVSLSEFVLAGLCAKWVGLPDGERMVAGGRVNGASLPPRCPGHLLTASRYVFAPHPRPDVLADGPAQGRAALQAVEALLASGRPLGTLAGSIQTRLQAIGASPELIARNIAGVLLGFPPTVHGNFLRTMETWIDDKLLWACQQRLSEISPRGTTAFNRARRALLGPLFTTMRERPIPEVLWRCPVVGGEVVHDAGQRVVLGIASALTDPAASDMLMFGGSRVTSKDPEAIKTLHACPGYEMGTGVMLGLIATLLDAGTLRPTGSPVLLMLTPNPSPNPNPS